MVPVKQSNSKLSTVSNRSKLSLRRKKGKGDENLLSQTKSSCSTKATQLGDHSCHKNSVEQEMKHITSPKGNIAHQNQFEASSVVDRVTVQPSSALISTNKQSTVEVHSEDRGGDACDSNTLPTTSQNRTTISEHSSTQHKHAQLSTNSLTTVSQTVDEDDMMVNNVPMHKTTFEMDNNSICHICTEDISHLTMVHQLEHLDSCIVTSKNTSAGTSAFDTKQQLISEEAPDRVKFCNRDERTEILPFLELPQNAPQSATTPAIFSNGATKPAQTDFKDCLFKKEPAVSGRSKVDSQSHCTDGEDDDFKLPLSHSLSKLGMRRKNDFQENYIIEEEQLQIALALSASIDPVQPVCLGEVEKMQPMSKTFQKPKRKQSKMAKRLKMSTVPPLLAITSEQAQSLLARRAEEILRSTRLQLSHDDELPSTPSFGSSDLANCIQSEINHNVESRASRQTVQEHDNQIFSVCDFDGKSSAVQVKQNVLDVDVHQLHTESEVHAEVMDEVGGSLTEVVVRRDFKDPGIPPHQSQTVILSSKEDYEQLQEQSSCPNRAKEAKIENPTSLFRTNFQQFSYSTLWQVSSGEKDCIEEFYVPALASVVSPVKKCKVSEKKPQVQWPPSSCSSWTQSPSSSRSSWTSNGIPKLCSDLSNLVGSTMFSDVLISTSNGANIPAHAALLAARCPALRKELTSSYPMKLDLTDYEDSTVLDFLRFLYTGSLPPSTNIGVTDLAHKWSVEELLLTNNHDRLTATQEIPPTPSVALDSSICKPDNQSIPKQAIEFPDSSKVILEIDSSPIHLHGKIITLDESIETNRVNESNVGVGDIEVMMEDSGDYDQCKSINITSPSYSPKEDSSKSNINPQTPPLETESLHQSLPKTPLYDSILVSPEGEASLPIDLCLSPKSVTAVSKESYGCNQETSPQSDNACIQHCNTSCLSVSYDSITMPQGSSEGSVGVDTRPVECSVISESNSDQDEMFGQLLNEHSPRTDELDSKQHLDSPSLFEYFKTPTNVPSVFDDSSALPSSQTKNTSTLGKPGNLRSSPELCLDIPSEYCRFKTPMSNTRICIESDDNITPMPSYLDMVTPALKVQCGRFGVKPLAKRKMIAKLEEIYEYTHPLVDPSGAIIPPEQGPVKERQPKIQTKLSKRKANAEHPDTVAPGGTSQAMNELLVSSDLKAKVRDCISSDKELYKDVLIFKPIELSMIQSKLRGSGLSVAKDKLMDILDHLCVTFTSPRTRRRGKVE